MMTKKKIFLTIGLLALVAAVLVYNHLYQDHRDIESEAPAFTVMATKLSAAFEENEDAATRLYLNKTIQVTGTVLSMDGEVVMMEPSIFFALSENQGGLKPDPKTEVQIKGRCIGYDSILEEIKFDQSFIVNQP